MKRKHLCLAILIASFFMGLAIKLYLRPEYYGYNNIWDIILGSAPNFLFVLGFSFLPPIFKCEIPLKKFIGSTTVIALGSIVYEIEQDWGNLNITVRTFDIYDLIAIVIAAFISVSIFHSIFPQQKTSAYSLK